MNTLLMLKDTPVLKFNLDEGLCIPLNKTLIPYQLSGKLRDVPELNDNATRYDMTQALIAMNKNNQTLTSYFASRVLPLTRENAKKIYSLFGFEQAQDDYSKALIAITCRSVSLQDDYWVKNENDPTTWKEVNLRTNSLSETVAQVSLHGTSLTLKGIEHTPELNGQGAYAKAWKREPNGLFLYKLGSDNKDIESRIEVMVSGLLDKTNVPHVHYYNATSQGRFACKCKCMTTENRSILSGMDFRSYCSVNNKNADKEIMDIDSTNIYKMWIVDYLISNRDRHGMNWGFYYDSNTMQILGCHPLFDHNNAFDKELMKDKNAPYLFNNKMTMLEAAKYAIKKTDFHFLDKINKEDFIDDIYYESFMSRTSDLGLQPQKGTTFLPIDIRDKYSQEYRDVKKEISDELNSNIHQTTKPFAFDH